MKDQREEIRTLSEGAKQKRKLEKSLGPRKIALLILKFAGKNSLRRLDFTSKSWCQ
jgi:hypothetical protein